MTVTPTSEAPPRILAPGNVPLWGRIALPAISDLFFLTIFVFATLGVWASRLLWDTSTGWHIRNGEQILRSHAIPRSDSFSYTMAGRPWFAWEWLWDAANGAVHGRFGLSGVVALAAVVLALTFALTYWLVARRSRNALVAAGLTVIVLGASSIHLLARPHVVSWLFCVLLLRELELAHSGSRRPFWSLPLLFAVWANLHGGFVVGLALIAVCGVSAVIERKPLILRRFASLLSLAAAATVLNPYGLKLHEHVLRYLGSRVQMNNIEEFLSPNFHHLEERFFLLLIVIVVGLLTGRQRVMWRDLLLIIFAIAIGVVAARNIPIAAILLAYATAPAAGEWFQGSRLQRLAAMGERMYRTDRQLKAHLWPTLVVFLFFAAFVTGYRLPRAHWDETRVPVAAGRYLVHELGVRDHAFTPDYLGGYFIYSYGADGFKVAVDDRSDFYGDARFSQYMELTHAGPDWRKVTDDWGLRYALVDANSSLRSVLAAAPDWREVYADKVAAVFVRDNDSLKPHTSGPGTEP